MTGERFAENAEKVMNGEADPVPDAWAELDSLLGLPAVGVKITGGQMIGTGRKATGIIEFSNGNRIEYDQQLGDMAIVTRLKVDILLATGARPKLTADIAMDALGLFRVAAEHTQTAVINSDIRETGAEYLRLIRHEPVTMNDQGSRWAAFTGLQGLEPLALHARDDTERVSPRSTSSSWTRAPACGTSGAATSPTTCARLSACPSRR
jgi:hypothetical protein